MSRRAAGGKDKRRPVQLVLDARGDDADHALVKLRVKHADGRRWLGIVGKQVFCQQQRLVAHTAFNVAPLAVDAVERARQCVGVAGVVGQQAFDANRHIGQTPGGVDAWPQGKAKVKRRRHRRFAPSDVEQRRHAGGHRARADAL